MHAQPFTYTYIHTLKEIKETVHQYQSRQKRKRRSVSETPEYLLPPYLPAFSQLFFSVSGTRKENFWSLNLMVKKSGFLPFAMRQSKAFCFSA